MNLPSINDRAVFALAIVADIGKDLSNDSPERHIVRRMKRVAEEIMSDAFVRATEIAWQAGDVSKEFEAMKQVIAETGATT